MTTGSVLFCTTGVQILGGKSQLEYGQTTMITFLPKFTMLIRDIF